MRFGRGVEVAEVVEAWSRDESDEEREGWEIVNACERALIPNSTARSARVNSLETLCASCLNCSTPIRSARATMLLPDRSRPRLADGAFRLSDSNVRPSARLVRHLSTV